VAAGASGARDLIVVLIIVGISVNLGDGVDIALALDAGP